MSESAFTDEQKQYLQGFLAGSEIARHVRGLPTLSGGGVSLLVVQSNPAAGANDSHITLGPESVHRRAQDRVLAEGKKLCNEEKASRDKNALDMWDEMRENAAAARFPKGTDVFLYKFHGLFHVAPAQNSFMCRLRVPGGIMPSYQFRGVADLADRCGGGYADVTTRANLQIREIGPAHTLDVITGLRDLGIINRGAGADNIRNVTASPTAGIDPDELIDTRALAKAMHYHIINHREMYGLPRKFNIAFDGGGRVAVLEDTNDIGFAAVRVAEQQATEEVPAGIYFRLQLGGITGHRDFARDTGVLVKPEECIPVAAAVVRVYNEHGDRTDRNKARLKYLLDAWGFERYLQETQKHLSFPLRLFPLDQCEPRKPATRHAHIGFHAQRQSGLAYVGVVLPVGRLTAEQMRGLADIADRFGSGTIRLTVWQNLLISDVPDSRIPEVQDALSALDLDWRASSFRAGLVACTGNAGCKYAASNTKSHAMEITRHLESRFEIDQPINIHLTGCHHSCAQHYIGDVGLLATKVARGDDMIEGYHVYLGGGYGSDQQIAREFCRDVPADRVPIVLEEMLKAYLADRSGPEESFAAFTRRRSIDDLRRILDERFETVAA